MQRILLLATTLFLTTMNLKAQETYAIVWADECNGSGMIDTSKWFHQTKLPNGSSWYNGEIQHYTNRVENTYQEDGSMYINAIAETYTQQGVTKEHTSARLNSKFAFTYGKVEVRAMLPYGDGTWPAIWTLGKNISETGAYWEEEFGTTGWPTCGEIDIMEHWGANPNYVSSALHTPSSFGGTVNVGGRSLSDVFNTWHVYAMEWTEDKIVFTIDGEEHYTYDPEVKDGATWPFDKDQYILLNVAILPSISSSFTENAMVIDYVRVYQKAPTGIEEERDKGFELYPNPSNGSVHITLPQEFTGGQLSVRSIDGKVVSVQNGLMNSIWLDTSALASGVYFVQAESLGGASLIEKMIVR